MAVDKFPVEASHIMMFARSVADDNQIYYDEDYASGTEVGHIIAPPTFAQSSAQFDPDYFLRPKVGQDWFGSGKEPTGIRKKEGSGGGGKVRLVEFVLDKVTLGSEPSTLIKTNVNAQRHEQDINVFQGVLGFEVSGLISHDFFKGASLIMDFENMHLIVK